ncbi:L-lysine 6-transaminase precursor [Halopolyspora algeriensis]|uniref:L-lysine-epsilon aminotransferase n=1 Tax=Halopolyspora algeriensis TaxID=1500506 RepID=A0A368VPQ0_9ACTN|nr:L-lysine 6-transaminase [Halopolyspora algeriensis]RCW43709.1 L-lysine 6-transaminase precursor [Halopolyspora algeriensis]TQM47508.1 L-lysine 6-transaminase precursor [Halopolyspora algeriensis]
MTAQRETADSTGTELPRQRAQAAAQDSAAAAVTELRAHVAGDLLDIVVDLDGGEGCRLRDLRDGTEYLDMTMFFSSAPLGHGHPGLREPDFEAALVRASRVKPANPDFATVEQARFAETLKRVFGDPELPLLFFIEGGGPAVENALKIAFDWKTKCNAARSIPVRGCRAMHLQHAFHGRTGYTMSLTNTDPTKVRDYPVFDWPRIPSPAVDPDTGWDHPELLPAERTALEAAEAALQRYGHEIACFVYEPIQGEGGDRHLRPEFLRAMQELCREHGVLTIADEVQTGGGITGCAWAYQALGLEPDLVAFGKRVQVCGVMGGRRVLDIADNAFREGSRISSTWGGGLVDMVRATRILETVESEDLLPHTRRMGEILLAELRGLAEEFPSVLGHPRGRGLMCAVDFPDSALRDRAITIARERHHTLFLPSGPRSLRWRPALSVRQEELTDAVQALRKTLGELS